MNHMNEWNRICGRSMETLENKSMHPKKNTHHAINRMFLFFDGVFAFAYCAIYTFHY